MTLRPEAEERIRELKNDPIAALNGYEAPLGWEMGRHRGLIGRRRRQFATPSEAAADDTFLWDLYVIVRAWYGTRAWLMIAFDDRFKHEIRKAACNLDHLSDLDITNTNYDVGAATDRLWDVIGKLKITTADARIVSGTKAIHHLVPDLIPPMDNRYTGEFFLGYSIGQGSETVFSKIYQAFIDLARSLTCDEKFMECVGRGFNTSVTKTVDNAIIGYVQSRGR